MRKDKAMIDLEKKAKMKESLEEMNAFVEKAEGKKEELIAKAKKAKLKNDKPSYRLACLGLANIIARKNTVERMVLSMDVIMTLRDVSKMTSGFTDAMRMMSEEVAALSKDNNFSKISKEFSKAMASFDQQTAGLDNLLDETTLNLETMDTGLSDNMLKEIELMIDADAVLDEGELDKSIEKKLERLRGQGKI